MALSPMDIMHKEFSHGLRGYDVAQVDEFLEEVKDEIARLQAEAQELTKRLAAADQKIAHYAEIESTLNSAFISAQQSADSIKEQARDEGERIYREAEAKAQEIVHKALAEKQKTLAEYDRLKNSEDQFRRSYKELLAHFVAEADKIPGASDPAPAQAEPVWTAPAPEVVADESSDEAPALEVFEEVVVEEVAVAEEAPQEPEVTATASPAVQIIEEEEFEVASDDAGLDAPVQTAPVAEEKKDATFLGYESLGEIEEDLDIEEID